MSEADRSTPILPAHGLAVLVIDVQIGPFSTDPLPFEANEVVGRINSVTAKARAAKVPVFFVRHDGPPDPHWRVRSGWELHPELKIAEGEPIISKTTCDSFYGTNLEKTLRSLGIRSLLLMGYATDFCIDATLRNAASKDFEIFIVSDAHTTNDSIHLSASLIREHFNWAWTNCFSSREIHLVPSSNVRFCGPV